MYSCDDFDFFFELKFIFRERNFLFFCLGEGVFGGGGCRETRGLFEYM